MRSRTRPFTIEIKRARRNLAQSTSPAITADYLLEEDIAPERVGIAPFEDLAPETGRGEALALAAQVFGEPVLAQPNSTDLRRSFVPADSSLSAEPVPNKPRVLPDLLAIAREQIEATEAVKPRRIATRSRGKTKGEGASSPSRQAVLQFDSPKQSDETPLEHDTEPAARAARRASLNPALTSAMRSHDIETTPIRPPTSGAAVRSHRRNASTWGLPRSERWKERRLPRVCWDKFAR